MDFWRVQLAPHTAIASTGRAAHGMPLWCLLQGAGTTWIPHVQDVAALLVARCYGMLSIGVTQRLAIMARTSLAMERKWSRAEKFCAVLDYRTLLAEQQLLEQTEQFRSTQAGA
jgi:hypothetical protein